MPGPNGDNCEHCSQKKGYASNEPLQPTGTETMCLNSECYEKRMADLAKTDIDQALEVCGAYEKAGRFRRAQEGSRAGSSRPSMRAYEEHPAMPVMEPWGPRHGHPGGFDVREEFFEPTHWADGSPIRKNDTVFVDEYGQMFGTKRRKGYQVMADWFRKRNR